MNVASFFYKVFITTQDFQNPRFIGTAFPITPDSGLLTCRHIVDVPLGDNETLAIFDNEKNRFVPISDFAVSRNPNIDAAFIPNALQRKKSEFFPLISPNLIKIGEDVYSFGYYLSGNNPDRGYFKGNIVNFSDLREGQNFVSISLSYAVIEGLSGSPVLTYHNGPKLVGMCYGNIQARVVASEIMEFNDRKEQFRETINRIVELGQAHHARALVIFLQEINARDFIISSERVDISGLED